MNNEEKARNFYVFWHRMLGYPGINNAYKLIRSFTHYKKIEWGRYNGRFIADIIMLDRQYIQWCINELPFFINKMSDEEIALFIAGENGYRIGGYKTEIIGDSCFSSEIEGDSYDSDFINSELKYIEEKI